MSPRVLLVDIGSAAPELPVVTPPAPRPPSSWTPDPRPSPGLPPPTGLVADAVADGALLAWTRSPAPGAQTIIEAAPDNSGTPGLWRELDRTSADTYMLSLPTGPRWARVRAVLNGRTSVDTNAVLAEPVDLSGSMTDLERELREIADQVAVVAAQAAAAAAALTQRADDLREDLDTTIAQVSTLGEVTETLGTELTRVETQSIERDTATTATLALLGAKNAAGTAFVLDQSKVQVSPGESLAQWRSSVQGQFQGQSSRIDSEEQARQDADQALANTLATVQATANNAATKAELTAAQTALAAADQAQAKDISLLRAELGASANLLRNGTFSDGLTGWTRSDTSRWGITNTGGVDDGAALHAKPGSADETYVINDARIPASVGEVFRLGSYVKRVGNGSIPSDADFRFFLRAYNSDGGFLRNYRAVGPDRWNTYALKLYEGEAEVTHADVASVTMMIYVHGLTDGNWAFDDAYLTRVSQARKALAQVVEQNRADVTQNANDITAAVARVVAAEAVIEGKASASELAATQLTVQQLGQTQISHGQTLNGLTASVGGVEASVNEVRSVVVEGTGGNRVANPGFETGDQSGWVSVAGAADRSVVNNAAGDVNKVLRVNASGALYNSVLVPNVPGRVYRLGGRVRRVTTPFNGTAYFGVRRFRADGSYHSYSGAVVSLTAGDLTSQFQDFAGTFRAQDDGSEVAFHRLQLGTNNHTTGAVAFDDVFLEPLSDAEARAMATYGFAVQAGGKVAGMKATASDDISVIDFISDMIRFSPQSGNNGWMYDGAKGQQITRGGNYMKVEGAPFGAGNNFLFWMGPYLSNIAQCSTNNALFAFLTNGNMFINGAIVNGVIEKTSSTNEIGPVATLGGDIFVDGSLRGTALFSQPASNGALQVQGSQSYTVSLQRRIGSGSWVTVATAQGSASWGTPMYLDTVPPTWQVSASGGIPTIEYVDTDPSLQDRSFRLVKGSVSGSLQWRSGPSGAWNTYNPPNNYRIRSSEVAG